MPDFFVPDSDVPPPGVTVMPMPSLDPISKTAR
jgi:hypothetical protein